jgi:hypothetical protein
MANFIKHIVLGKEYNSSYTITNLYGSVSFDLQKWCVFKIQNPNEDRI